jgi:hypothetical protein
VVSITVPFSAMWSSISLVSLLFAAGIARAQSPPGIYPQVSNAIVAGFGSRMISAGDNLTPDGE